MEAKIKIAVLCFDVSDIDIITVNNRLMETLKQNIDLPEKEKLRRLKEAKGGTWYDGWRPYCMMCNRSDNVWELKHKTSPYIGQEFFPSDLTDFDCRGELIEDLDDEDLLDIISKYGKDVVAIEWSTRGYSQGDYIKGIVYVTKEKYDNEVCNKEGDWKKQAWKI